MNDTQSGYLIPIAIIFAGILVAGAVFLVKGNENINTADNTRGRQNASEFRVPDETDHVRGNLSAPIAIVEFSDLECSFCARLHPTLKRITEENEDVKWVYRHFPLSTIHSRAFSTAVASECIAQFGNNDDFWTFVDLAFKNQRQLGDNWYKSMASKFNIDSVVFQSCLKDKNITLNVQEDLDEALASGGRGTPFVVVVAPSGQLIPFSGALPYEQIISLINQIRNN